MIAIPGKPILQADLEALSALAGAVGCPPSWDYEQSPPQIVYDAGGQAYRWEAYDDGVSGSKRRWLTELTRLRNDLLACAIAAMAPTAATPFDPANGVVSGSWIVPPGHPWFFDQSGTAWLSGLGFIHSAPNFGRTALGVKLWSRGVPTPFRVCGDIAPPWDFALEPGDDVSGYPGRPETSGTASFGFTRPAKVAGYARIQIKHDGTSNPGGVQVDFSACSEAPDDVIEIYRTEDGPDGNGLYTVDAQYQAYWGTCENPAGNMDIYNRESGFEADSVTVAFEVLGGGYSPVPGNADTLCKFYFSAHYGEAGGNYAACEAIAIGESAWYTAKEEPVFCVTSNFRKALLSGPEYPGYSNVAALWVEPLPATPNTPAETWWEAKLWAGLNMRRGGVPGETFCGQAEPTSGGAVGLAVPQVASDGLWVQSADDPAAAAEVSMDANGPRRQSYCWDGVGWRPAVDFLQITRRKPYGASPAVSVGIGCWRGTGQARAFQALFSVTLPAGLNRLRIDLRTLAGFQSLLPVFDNLSIGYTNAGLVTVRAGNWKNIGYDIAAIGQINSDGTPAEVVNDLEAICLALAILSGP